MTVRCPVGRGRAAGILGAQLRLPITTILIVEGDAPTADVLDLVLTEEGYTVVWAADGQAALDLLATVQPHLVLFELNLPGMDGRTLCRTLAADPQYQGIPRVLMSV